MSSNPPADALAGKLKRTELQRSALSVPGREVVQVLTEIPAGSSRPPRTAHNALDLGPETGQMLSTYIVEVDQPLATFVE